MRTPSRLVPLIAVSAAAVAATGPVSAADAAWKPTQSLTSTRSDAVPRVGVGTDGSAVLADRRGTDVVVASARPSGRFGAFKALTHQALSTPAVAAGPNGAALVAWLAKDETVRVAVRRRGTGALKVRRIAGLRGDEISTLAAAHDPRGGWVVAFDAFRGTKTGDVLQTVSLAPDGAVAVAPQSLGAAGFGLNARPTATLDVTPSGRAVLVADVSRSDPGTDGGATPGARTWTREHGKAFGAPTALGGTGADGAHDPRVAASDDGRYAISWTRARGCGETVCLGTPRVSTTAADGTAGPQTGPTPTPTRTFGPSAVPTKDGRTLLAWNERTEPDPFGHTATVRAATVAADGTPGPTQVLDASRKASEPLALPLSGGRAIVVWAGASRLRAAVGGTGSALQVIGGPAGPIPAANHFNATDRDVRSAGRWVAMTWFAGNRVRVARGRF